MARTAMSDGTEERAGRPRPCEIPSIPVKPSAIMSNALSIARHPLAPPRRRFHARIAAVIRDPMYLSTPSVTATLSGWTVSVE